MAKLVGVHTTTDLSQAPSEKLHSPPPRRTKWHLEHAARNMHTTCTCDRTQNLTWSINAEWRNQPRSVQLKTSRALLHESCTLALPSHPGFTLSASLCFKGLVTSPCWDRSIRIYFFGLVPDNSSELKTKSYFANFQGLGTWFPGPYRRKNSPFDLILENSFRHLTWFLENRG